jgi:hypothetical protein
MWRNLFQNFGKKKKKNNKEYAREYFILIFAILCQKKKKKRRLLTTRLTTSSQNHATLLGLCLDLWSHLDQSGGCVRGESAQHLGFGREAKKTAQYLARTHVRTHVRMHARFPHPMLSLRSRTRTGTYPQILASGRISGRDQDLGISISSSSSSLQLLRDS